MDTLRAAFRKKLIYLKKSLHQIFIVMGKIVRKLFFFSSGPVFYRNKDRYIQDPYLKDFKEELFKDKTLNGCAEDRKNMHNDVQNLRKSFKEAVKAAKSEEYAS